MKVMVDDVEILTFNETQKKVIQHEIPLEIFDEDMKRRVSYILTHKYEQCFKHLKKEWEPKLKVAGVKSIPLDDDEFAELVFSQKDYKSRSERDLRDSDRPEERKRLEGQDTRTKKDKDARISKKRLLKNR